MAKENEAAKDSNNRAKIIIGCVVVAVLAAACIFGYNYFSKSKIVEPQVRLEEYTALINARGFEQMYEYLDQSSRSEISLEDFVARNKGIYEGVEAKDINIDIGEIEENGDGKTVSYSLAMESVAGEISFLGESRWKLDEEGRAYMLLWDSTDIHPSLLTDYKVRVNTLSAERGSVYDRNGSMLAGKGLASSVGLVPGKMTEATSFMALAELLGITEEAVTSALSAAWVNDDSFVPLKTVKRADEIDPDPDALALQKALLEIPGVMITDVSVRYYPYAQAAVHLTGYVQGVTAKDIENDEEGIYDETSVIGKAGVEALYEERLRAVEGAEIVILDSNGETVDVPATKPAQSGEDITLTIDMQVMYALYTQYSEDKGCSAALNPNTGEVLALISTPAYDPNDFVLGLTDAQWNALNTSDPAPLTNRFRAAYAPGSAFKPVTAVMGLSQGAFTSQDDFGESGLKWQKDSSWGDYYVTTLHEYGSAVLRDALINSDNIYFAKAALKIGADGFAQGLTDMGFGETMEFDFAISPSSFSSDSTISTEIQLADSGYGQGEIQVSALHLASIYSGIINGGNMIQPYLELTETSAAEFWIEDAFSAQAASTVLEGLKAVIEDVNGTGHAAAMDSISLAGKTGTAEIKASQTDETGTELGWFCVFTTDKPAEESVLVVSMAEDVKDKGGSGYLVGKSKSIFQTIYGVAG